MTLLEVKNQLVTHFLSHDTFDPVKHAFDVTYDKEVADFREQMTATALAELEAAGFIRRFDSGDKSLWVLTQPIASFPQQVTLSPITCNMIASIVNFHNDLEEIDYVVDQTKIDESAIGRLIQIVSEYDDEAFGDDEEQAAPQEERE